jgi:hypothetical protein
MGQMAAELKEMAPTPTSVQNTTTMGGGAKSLAFLLPTLAAFIPLFVSGRKATERKVEIGGKLLLLLQSLSQSGINPRLFDFLLSNELDRELKRQFGIAFLAATVFFTLLSYAVIMLNSVQKWGISDGAIMALIVETPIQFIGLLYIIARNLFPQSLNVNRRRGTIDADRGAKKNSKEKTSQQG